VLKKDAISTKRPRNRPITRPRSLVRVGPNARAVRRPSGVVWPAVRCSSLLVPGKARHRGAWFCSTAGSGGWRGRLVNPFAAEFELVRAVVRAVASVDGPWYSAGRHRIRRRRLAPHCRSLALILRPPGPRLSWGENRCPAGWGVFWRIHGKKCEGEKRRTKNAMPSPTTSCHGERLKHQN
jgi:hypothetical protein